MLARLLITGFVRCAHVVRRLMQRSERSHKFLYIKGFEAARWRIGKWKAACVFDRARRTVPAYAEFLRDKRVDEKGLWTWNPDLTGIPECDKESYIKKFSIESRCVGGALPARGAVIDESSGTSGLPNNWVRGAEEREDAKRILQLSLHATVGDKPMFLINAFALGPWATGMNVSMSLVDVTVLKSTGPDIAKIENTLLLFGPAYSYVITGYPPFLKLLADSKKIDWKAYDISIVCGGEGLSEAMRTYMLRTFKRVISSYGASDLEINIAAENDFTVALRRLLDTRADLREQLTRRAYGSQPMIFQYNPLDYHIETNAAGELVVTLCRAANAAPKIRYNIHDNGHVLRMPELQKILRETGADKELPVPRTDLPLLFHYGRSDMAVGFYGCKITPSDMESVLFSLPELSGSVSSFALLTSEDKDANKTLTIAVELRPDTAWQGDLGTLRDAILEKLKTVNQDFRESAHMIPSRAVPAVEMHAYGQGPFANNDIRLKKRYIQTEGPKGA